MTTRPLGLLTVNPVVMVVVEWSESPPPSFQRRSLSTSGWFDTGCPDADQTLRGGGSPAAENHSTTPTTAAGGPPIGARIAKFSPPADLPLYFLKEKSARSGRSGVVVVVVVVGDPPPSWFASIPPPPCNRLLCH